MKFGILGCAFECADVINEVLSPWRNVKTSKPNGNELLISISSIQFSEYADLGYKPDNSDTLLQLELLHSENVVDFYYSSKDTYKESYARNFALNPLLSNNCDFIWILDCNDEFYTEEQIIKTMDFVANNEFVDWFSINFRNYIFDGKKYIKGFCPPRIFRNKTASGLSLDKFYWDNDMLYKGKNIDNVNYTALPSRVVPGVEVKHLTWLHTNGQKKYEYQMKHFGNCSYKWNYEKSELEFNPDFYKNHPMPTVYEA